MIYDTEHHGVQRLLEGMRNLLPELVSIWLSDLERTEKLEELGFRMAQTFLLNRIRAPQMETVAHGAAATEEMRLTRLYDDKFRTLEQRLEAAQAAIEREQARANNAEAEVQRQLLRASRAESEVARWKSALDKEKSRSFDELVRVQNEMIDLRRIVGEQQFKLNQSGANTD